MVTKSSIAVPSTGTISKSLGNYGMGLVAGLGYRLVSGFTGNSLIGGAIAAALTGAMLKGPAGEIIAVNAGFLTGQAEGVGGLLGGFGGLLGGGGRSADSGVGIDAA